MNQLIERMDNSPSGSPQVLLMEDETSVALGLEMILREEGYGVDWTTTGKKAIETLNHKGIDLLVADLRLPDMDGMEVIKRVKNNRPETEVIVITGYASVPSAVEAMKTGAVGYLQKPFTEDEFKIALEEAFKEKSRHSNRKSNVTNYGVENLIQKKEVMMILEKDLNYTFDEHDIIKKSPDFPPGHDHSGPGQDFHSAKDRGEDINRFSIYGKALVENAIDGIMVCDKIGHVVIFNNNLEMLLDYPAHEVYKKMSFYDFFPAIEEKKFKELLYSERCGGPHRLFSCETKLLSKAGAQIPVIASAVVLSEKGRELGIAAFFRDLKATRDVEHEISDQEHLLHQDKMISLGKLAASVVHEINNPLMGILNYIRLTLKIIDRGSLEKENIIKFQRYLGLVENETDRCSKIVSNLLAFSRKSKPVFDEVDINELLDKCIMLSQHKLVLQNIEIKTALSEELPKVWGDFNQMQQCIINLIFNAIDAMPEGGTLTVSSSFHAQEGTIEMSVADTGYGIAEEEIPKIFDPFYTAKKEGQGVGLGLSTVYGIINHHHGTIHVDSELGAG
ncbi:response regulator, partial [Thermodesulfobacteriota bacterium]